MSFSQINYKMGDQNMQPNLTTTTGLTEIAMNHAAAACASAV